MGTPSEYANHGEWVPGLGLAKPIACSARSALRRAAPVVLAKTGPHLLAMSANLGERVRRWEANRQPVVIHPALAVS